MSDADAARLMSQVRSPTTQDPRVVSIQHAGAPGPAGIGSGHFLAATDSMDSPISSNQLPPMIGAPVPGFHGYPPTQPSMPQPTQPERSSSARTIALSILLALVLAAVSFSVVYFYLSPNSG
jgi:hypothetical protein